MKVTIFKPNSKTTGALGEFNISQKGDEEPIFYLKLVSQHSWDETKRTGSFAESIKNPSKVISLKFNEFELGEIVNAFNRQSIWTTFHDFNDKVGISLKPWQKKTGKGENAREYTAFGISVTRNGADTFKLPLEPGEAARLTALINTYYAWLDEARRIKYLKFVSKSPASSSKAVSEPTVSEPDVPNVPATDEPDF